jgi:hypothetical protein
MVVDLARIFRARNEGNAFGLASLVRKHQRVPCLPILILLLLHGCAATPPSRHVGPSGANSTLIVVRRGWHIDVGFGTAQISSPLNALDVPFPGSQYLLFGFGDKHYLVAKHKSFPQLLGALWPGEAMMLVTSLSVSPEEAFGGDEQVIRLALSATQAQAAQDFIWNSFIREDAAPTLYASGPYAGSAFFLSSYHYSAVHTCNTWAAEVLQAAGLPVHPAGVMFAGQLWSQVRNIEAARQVQTSAHATHNPTFALVH